ncbi:MAG: PhzF family phenazine biosynthesis protein [Bacteroidota bacterium]
MRLPIYQVDAFTKKVFGGNPAAVCPLDDWIDESTMQQIAIENNLAETAFFVKKDGHYEIRWFMPSGEINLCGHATLASAFVLFHFLQHPTDEVIFSSQSGELRAKQRPDGLITLDFPVWHNEPIDIPKEVFVAFNHRPIAAFSSRDLLLVFESEQQILDLRPQLPLLKHLSFLGMNCTAKGDEVDFVSRVFDANDAISEDPVTGSAHCGFVPYWAERLGKKELHARQLSARGGELFCELRGDRVLISGQAVLYLEGEIKL